MSEALGIIKMRDRTNDQAAINHFVGEQEVGRRASSYPNPETFAVVGLGEHNDTDEDPGLITAQYRDEPIRGLFTVANRGQGESARTEPVDVIVDHTLEGDNPHEVIERMGDLALSLEEESRQQAGVELDPARIGEIYSKLGELAGMDGYGVEESTLHAA